MAENRPVMQSVVDETPRRGRGDAGSGAVFLVVVASALILVIGLTFDGGQILAGRRQAIDVAQQASIAGAQAVDLSQARQGNVTINGAAVIAAANNHLAAAGHTGTVSVSGTEVTVVVTDTVDMSILSIIGLGSQTVTGQGTSRIVRGVEAADS